jgi:hypothetical protein
MGLFRPVMGQLFFLITSEKFIAGPLSSVSNAEAK